MIRKTRKTDNIKECFPKEGFYASYQLLILTQINLRPTNSSKNKQIHQQQKKTADKWQVDIKGVFRNLSNTYYNRHFAVFRIFVYIETKLP